MLMLNRIRRAILLDKAVYGEVAADKSATGQAIALVLLVSIAISIGEGSGSSLPWHIWSIAVALPTWAFESWIVWYAGTKLLPEPQTEADWGQVARALAFANSIWLIAAITVFPFITPYMISFFAITLLMWWFIAAITAAQQVLSYSSLGRGATVILIGMLPSFLISWSMDTLLFGG